MGGIQLKWKMYFLLKSKKYWKTQSQRWSISVVCVTPRRGTPPYTGRLRRKGVPFPGITYVKR